MFLFPVDGALEVILSYGQLLSLFLVLIVFEGVISAKAETSLPGLVFILLIVLLGVGIGIGFGDIAYFLFMLIPAFLCLFVFYITRRTRAKNIEKGVRYNQEGLIEEELRKMEGK